MKQPTDKPRPFPWGWAGLATLILVSVILMIYQPWIGAAPAGEPVAFDGARCMKYLDAVCDIGPRIAGTDGMVKQRKLMDKHFTDLGGKVTYQKFMSKQRGKKSIEMQNMIVSWRPEKLNRVILCSHYDTRPVADQEPNPRKWTEPFVSANDGGSGVAFLMEMAHHMKGMKLKVGVDFVFYDGEEYIHDPEEGLDNYFLGSTFFTKAYGKDRERKYKYTKAVLLDMIAGKGAAFPKEQNSVLAAGKLVKEVWDIAAELKCGAFEKGLSKVAVSDDHVPMNEGGIPTIDIIDFEYPHWHRLTDVAKSCDAKPMIQVAKVLSVWMQRQE